MQEYIFGDKSLPTGWIIENGELRKNFLFKSFREAIEFVQWVADVSEAANHHPDIDIRYNRVQLSLITHDLGHLSSKDYELARKIG